MFKTTTPSMGIRNRTLLICPLLSLTKILEEYTGRWCYVTKTDIYQCSDACIPVPRNDTDFVDRNSRPEKCLLLVFCFLCSFLKGSKKDRAQYRCPPRYDCIWDRKMSQSKALVGKQLFQVQTAEKVLGKIL